MDIVHPPFTVVFPTFFTYVALSVAVKFSLVLSAVTAVNLVSYHYLVRPTFIGQMLNGRCYPRS